MKYFWYKNCYYALQIAGTFLEVRSVNNVKELFTNTFLLGLYQTSLTASWLNLVKDIWSLNLL